MARTRLEAAALSSGSHGFYVGLPKAIPEKAESTRQAVAFLEKHFAAAKP